MATSLAICKIFEQVYKILLQDVSDFDASQPASFLQEPYVWDSASRDPPDDYRATARDVITHRNQCKIHFRMASKTRYTNVRYTRTTFIAFLEFLYKWMPLHLVYTIAMLVCEETRR